MRSFFTKIRFSSIDLSLDPVQISYFRILFGLWLLVRSLTDIYYWHFAPFLSRLMPLEVVTKFVAAYHADGITRSVLLQSSGETLLLVCLGLQVLLSIAFILGIFFPWCGWFLAFLILQTSTRGATLLDSSDFLIFWSLLWASFLPLCEKLSLKTHWNSKRFWPKLHSLFVVQIGIAFFFFAVNHFNPAWIYEGTLGRYFSNSIYTNYSNEALQPPSDFWQYLTFLLPFVELFICLGVFFKLTRNISAIAIIFFSLLLAIAFRNFSFAITLSLLGMAIFQPSKSPRVPSKRVTVVEYYLLGFLFLGSLGAVDWMKVSEKGVPVQLASLLRKYFFSQRWELLGVVPKVQNLVLWNGQPKRWSEFSNFKSEVKGFSLWRQQELNVLFYRLGFYKFVENQQQSYNYLFCELLDLPTNKVNVIQVEHNMSLGPIQHQIYCNEKSEKIEER